MTSPPVRDSSLSILSKIKCVGPAHTPKLEEWTRGGVKDVAMSFYLSSCPGPRTIRDQPVLPVSLREKPKSFKVLQEQMAAVSSFVSPSSSVSGP